MFILVNYIYDDKTMKTKHQNMDKATLFSYTYLCRYTLFGTLFFEFNLYLLVATYIYTYIHTYVSSSTNISRRASVEN